VATVVCGVRWVAPRRVMASGRPAINCDVPELPYSLMDFGGHDEDAAAVDTGPAEDTDYSQFSKQCTQTIVRAL